MAVSKKEINLKTWSLDESVMGSCLLHLNLFQASKGVVVGKVSANGITTTVGMYSQPTPK